MLFRCFFPVAAIHIRKSKFKVSDIQPHLKEDSLYKDTNSKQKENDRPRGKNQRVHLSKDEYT